ncbi:MAG: decaprenyl-phosphate phosphoribosyltransferase [Acidobacteriia bacterium]|nr:decaprenyl-phosphate phosphoribosyltransferase [Terriglobia bacterium]
MRPASAIRPTITVPNGSRNASAAVRLLRGCVRLLRVRQWLKNGFIFAPLIFAGGLTNRISISHAIWAFLSFSLVASAVYVLNDWFDQKEDRQHPEKCGRPIASGDVPGRAAAILVVCLIVVGGGLAWLTTNIAVAGLEAIYLAINVYYSLSLKHVVILDVFAIATGFVIRVLVGAVAVGVPASHWLLLCTLLLALFLGFAKRRSELEWLENEGVSHRNVLAFYSPALITQLNLVLCSATVVCYALYTVAPETVAKFGSDNLIYTVPFVLYGLFRYLFLVEIRHYGENPSSLVLRDRPFALCVLLWLLACTLVIYSPIIKGGKLP